MSPTLKIDQEMLLGSAFVESLDDTGGQSSIDYLRHSPEPHVFVTKLDIVGQ
jgi:hypothetical protein